jgi:diketogulonate reductase-like aldo/keto reductase
LEHLQTDSIDSFLLHGPTQRIGLTPNDWDAWRAMEAIHDSGRAKSLGVSNVTLEQLEEFCRGARVKLSFVQNRCYASDGWNRRVREFCLANNIIYQGFSLLTANVAAVQSETLKRIAQRHGKTAAQVVFRFALDVGMMPLTGTTNADHMSEDLAALDFRLDQAEIAAIDALR